MEDQKVTTIQVSDEVRKRIKIIAANLDISYETLIIKALDALEKEMKNVNNNKRV